MVYLAYVCHSRAASNDKQSGDHMIMMILDWLETACQLYQQSKEHLITTFQALSYACMLV